MQFTALLPVLQASLGFANIADGLAVVEQGGYLRLLFASRDDARLGSVLLAQGYVAPASPTAPQIGQSPGEDIAVQVSGADLRVFVFSSYDGLMRQALLNGTALPKQTKAAATSDGPLFGVTAMEVFERGATDLAVVARKGQPGVTVYQMAATGELTRLSTLQDGPKSYLGDVADLAGFERAGRSFLMVASPLENGLTLFEIDANGAAIFIDALGANTGLPVGGPTALCPVLVGDKAFVVVASTGSSSLSVVRVNEAGAMFETDHLLDDRNTRFFHPAAMDVFTFQGRSFIVAAGTDAGLSVLELLPDGRLSHIGTHVAEATAAANITGLETAVIGSLATVFLTDARGDRLQRIEIDLATMGGIVLAQNGAATGSALDDRILGSQGADRLSGAGGQDYIHDGAGADSLTGGAGADVFVFDRDGVADQITDFQQGVDKIDLRDWGRIYTSDVLSLVPNATGAIISYWAESLTVLRAGGGSLTLSESDFVF